MAVPVPVRMPSCFVSSCSCPFCVCSFVRKLCWASVTLNDDHKRTHPRSARVARSLKYTNSTSRRRWLLYAIDLARTEGTCNNARIYFRRSLSLCVHQAHGNLFGEFRNTTHFRCTGTSTELLPMYRRIDRATFDFRCTGTRATFRRCTGSYFDVAFGTARNLGLRSVCFLNPQVQRPADFAAFKKARGAYAAKPPLLGK